MRISRYTISDYALGPARLAEDTVARVVVTLANVPISIEKIEEGCTVGKIDVQVAPLVSTKAVKPDRTSARAG